MKVKDDHMKKETKE